MEKGINRSFHNDATEGPPIRIGNAGQIIGPALARFQLKNLKAGRTRDILPSNIGPPTQQRCCPSGPVTSSSINGKPDFSTTCCQPQQLVAACSRARSRVSHACALFSRNWIADRAPRRAFVRHRIPDRAGPLVGFTRSPRERVPRVVVKKGGKEAATKAPLPSLPSSHP